MSPRKVYTLFSRVHFQKAEAHLVRLWKFSMFIIVYLILTLKNKSLEDEPKVNIYSQL